MKRLLTSYNSMLLLLDGKVLNNCAVMQIDAIKSFLELSKIYLGTIKSELSGKYAFNTRTSKIYLPNGLTEYKYLQELLVSDKDYEFLRKKLFELAYTKCSRVAENGASFKSYGLKDSGLTDLIENLLSEDETYSCIYSTDNKSWNELRSERQVLQEDKEERFALFLK